MEPSNSDHFVVSKCACYQTFSVTATAVHYVQLTVNGLDYIHALMALYLAHQGKTVFLVFFLQLLAEIFGMLFISGLTYADNL